MGKRITCPECKGTGKAGGSCGWCGGHGKVFDINAKGDGFITCPRCKGSGKSSDRCDWCQGKGYYEE